MIRTRDPEKARARLWAQSRHDGSDVEVAWRLHMYAKPAQPHHAALQECRRAYFSLLRCRRVPNATGSVDVTGDTDDPSALADLRVFLSNSLTTSTTPAASVSPLAWKLATTSFCWLSSSLVARPPTCSTWGCMTSLIQMSSWTSSSAQSPQVGIAMHPVGPAVRPRVCVFASMSVRLKWAVQA